VPSATNLQEFGFQTGGNGRRKEEDGQEEGGGRVKLACAA